jgi:hypothetical protein
MAGHSEKKEPWVITSPDNKLQTLHHRMSVNRFGHRVVEGVVRNSGPESIIKAEIKVEYYDNSGTIIGTEVDIIKIMQPGKTGAFEVVYSGERRWDIKRYRIVALQQIQADSC